MTSSFVNKKELLVVAMKRSGHHAIINWILQNTQGKTCFLNDIPPRTNPFVTASNRTSLLNDINRKQEIAGIHQTKDLLIYNYLTSLPASSVGLRDKNGSQP